MPNITTKNKSCPSCFSSKVAYERNLGSYRLLKCQNCTLVFSALSKEEIEAANSNYDTTAAATYEERSNAIDKAWYEIIFEKYGLKKNGSVLDIGCGHATLLKRFVDKGWDCYGLDISEWVMDYSKKIGFKATVGTLESANFDENMFDLIVSTSTFEHIPNPHEHLKEILRILKPGGKAYIAGMPNYGSLSIRLGLSAFHCNYPPEHCNYFTRSSLRTLAEIVANQSAEEITSVSVKTTSYGIPEAWLIYNKLLSFIKKFKIIDRSNTSKSDRKDSPLKRPSTPWLAKSFVHLYLLAGKPFGLGAAVDLEMRKSHV